MIPLPSFTATYEIVREGKPVGESTVSQSLKPDGSGRRQLKMTVRAADATVTVAVLTLLGPNAEPTREVQDTRRGEAKGRITNVQVIAEYDATGATVTLTTAKGRQVRRLDAPEGVSRANLAEGWFGPAAPKAGTEATYAALDLTAARWNVITATMGADGAIERTVAGTARRDRVRLDPTGVATALSSANGFSLRRTSVTMR